MSECAECERLRDVNADLLAACEGLLAFLVSDPQMLGAAAPGSPNDLPHPLTQLLVSRLSMQLKQARAAVAKAKGG